MTESTSGSTSVKDAFSDLNDIHSEYAKFFGDTFDQIEAMSLELFARHKRLELSTQTQAEQEAFGAQYVKQFQECIDQLQALREEYGSGRKDTEKMWSEISAFQQQYLEEHSELRETQKELQRIAKELQAMRDGVEQERAESQRRQENIENHLQKMAKTVTETIAAQTMAGTDEQIAQLMESARQQEAAWQKDREGLETELETERQRTARQNEMITDQRRLAAEQQAELAGELKRMRSLLELLLNHMNQPMGGDGRQSGSENSALESMLAQFEMLQRDLAQRRASSLKETAKR